VAVTPGVCVAVEMKAVEAGKLVAAPDWSGAGMFSHAETNNKKIQAACLNLVKTILFIMVISSSSVEFKSLALRRQRSDELMRLPLKSFIPPQLAESPDSKRQKSVIPTGPVVAQ
jgi:hypothetical protein